MRSIFLLLFISFVRKHTNTGDDAPQNVNTREGARHTQQHIESKCAKNDTNQIENKEEAEEAEK